MKRSQLITVIIGLFVAIISFGPESAFGFEPEPGGSAKWQHFKPKCYDGTGKTLCKHPTQAEIDTAGNAAGVTAPGVLRVAKILSGHEGGWGSYNGARSYAHFGAFQIDSGYFTTVCGLGSLDPLDFMSSPPKQVLCFFKLARKKWKTAKTVYENHKGHKVCEWTNNGKGTKTDNCKPLTQSSVVAGAWFGEAVPGIWVSNGFTCPPGTGTKKARDGAGTCTEFYMWSAAGQDVSAITDLEPDELNAGEYKNGKIELKSLTVAALSNLKPNDPTVELPGSVTGRPPGGATPPTCSDLNMLAGMTLTKKGFSIGAEVIATEVFNQHRTNSFASCIIKMVDYFDKIKVLLSSVVSMLGAVILAIVAAILNYVCNYVVSAINALLASVCLPVPSLSMSFNVTMPGTPSATCDGLSLLNLFQAQGGFRTSIPYSSSVNSFSLGVDQLIKTK